MADSLSRSCPTCEGFGNVRCGRCENDQDGFEDFPCHDPMPCPDCYGGYPKAAVERAAMAAYNADRFSFIEAARWEDEVEPVKDEYRTLALAAIRAFHNERSE